jgi:hypothetical protein
VASGLALNRRTRGLSEADGGELCNVGGADLVTLWLPMLPVPFGLPTSDGCGRVRWAFSPPFGEYRNVLGGNELDRSETVGPKLRELGVLGLKLDEGPWFAGGPAGLNEGRDGAAWNDLPEPKDGGLEGTNGADLGWLNDGGLEGIDGADLGWLNEGAGWLEPIDGPGRLELIDGPELPENDLCMLDIRSRPAACPAAEEPAAAWPPPPDLSRPNSRLLAIGAMSMAAIAAATAARDLLFFIATILLLLRFSSRACLAGFAKRSNNHLYHNSTVFKALRFFTQPSQQIPDCSFASAKTGDPSAIPPCSCPDSLFYPIKAGKSGPVTKKSDFFHRARTESAGDHLSRRLTMPQLVV